MVNTLMGAIVVLAEKDKSYVPSGGKKYFLTNETCFQNIRVLGGNLVILNGNPHRVTSHW